MGICRYQLTYVETHALANANGKKMLELGDQILNPYLAKEINFNVAKPYFSSIGYDHTSVDLNRKNGAEGHDLTKPKNDWNNHFNIVTNHGTSEHVVDQYAVFKNLHDWGCEGCIYAHCVPMDSEEHKGLTNRPWPRHGYWEYNTKFWEALAEVCGYELLSATNEVRNPAKNGNPINYYSSGVYKKTSESKFVDKDKFNDIVKKYMKRC